MHLFKNMLTMVQITVCQSVIVLLCFRIAAAIAGVIDAKHKIEEANFFAKGKYLANANNINNSNNNNNNNNNYNN